MIKSNLQGCTKDLTFSAQEQSVGSNYIKYNTDKTSRSFFFNFFFLEFVAQKMRLNLIELMNVNLSKRGIKRSMIV